MQEDVGRGRIQRWYDWSIRQLVEEKEEVEEEEKQEGRWWGGFPRWYNWIERLRIKRIR